MGQRGVALASLAQSMPGVEISWCVDNSRERLAEAPALFGTQVQLATDFREPLADDALDIVFVTVPDYLHRMVAEAAFRAGKHVFLEKPLATTVADANAILSAWQQSGRVLQLGYVLRQAPFYAAVRDVIRRRLLGPVRMAVLTEQLEVRHGAAFMRRWHANSSYSGGLLVHKGCHDLDILCWLLDARPSRIASFGGMATFDRASPAPYCSQCPERDRCPYVDRALYERRSASEAADPTAYGLDRCVFHPDKDIVDNQVVSFELDNGTRGSFLLAMQGPVRSERRICLIGDLGTLDGVFEDGRFQVLFTDSATEPLVWTSDKASQGGHGGGDRVTVTEFLNACVGLSPPPVSSPEEAMRGVIFAFAAEQARQSGSVVTLGSADFAF
jgi:predicted dehydrogenase